MEAWAETTASQTFTEFQTQMEVDDPTIDCGKRIYSLEGDPDPKPTYLTLDSGDPLTINLESTDESDVTSSPVPVRLVMELEHYPGVTWSVSFNVWVMGCEHTSFVGQDWRLSGTEEITTSLGERAPDDSPMLVTTIFSPGSDSLTFTEFKDLYT